MCLAGYARTSAQEHPIASPVEIEKRQVFAAPWSAFFATVAAVPLWATTILPLSAVYQIGRFAIKALIFRDDSDEVKLKRMDSGYSIDQERITPREKRQYDIVVLGSTGFCGSLAVRHLAKTYGPGNGDVKWAIVGRSANKLNALKKSLASELEMEELLDLDVLVADTLVPATLVSVIAGTRCVASTAGPYNLYGSHVVELCAKHGTHYVDITGEVDWVKAVASKWQKTAEQTGSKLIPFCGHDSIPWDVSTAEISRIMKHECGDELEAVTFWDEAIGGAPGGTFATMMDFVDGSPPPKVKSDPFFKTLEGGDSQHALDPQLPLLVSKVSSPWDGPESKRWQAPFIMAYVNAEVVRWSHSLRSEGIKSLVYQESMVLPDFKTAFVAHVGLIMGGSLILNPITKYLVKLLIPQSGQGPSYDDMENKHYLAVWGEGVGVNGSRVESLMWLPKDAGCLETARMLVESGLCLALQEKELPVSKGGFMTPSVALGEVLMQRLLETGTKFSYRVKK